MPTLLDKGELKYPDLPDVVPIDYVYDRIKFMMEAPGSEENPFADKVLILEAKTASGKSVTVPPVATAITKTVNLISHRKVICTQPKILTTISIPTTDIHNSPHFKKYDGIVFKLGENLGLQTSTYSEPIQGSGLMYVVLQVLMAQLINNPESVLKKYSAIIVDEAHERSKEFDRTIMMIKQLYLKYAGANNMPVLIFMSATFDYLKYANFFNVGMENVVRVSGASNPIDDRWPSTSVGDYIVESTKKAKSCILEDVREIVAEYVKPKMSTPEIESENRILIFMVGTGEIRTLLKSLLNWEDINDIDENTKLLEMKNKSRDDDIEILNFILEVDGNAIDFALQILPFDGQAVKASTKAYMKAIGGEERRNVKLYYMAQILVATNVAETGLSLDRLRYVIDGGWSKSAEFNPRVNVSDFLVTKPAAQSQITQRRGRVGRKKPGVFCPLYTKEVFDSLQKIQQPDIIISDPTAILLAYASIYGNLDVSAVGAPDTPNVIESRMLDVPSRAGADYSLKKLQMLGFIDTSGNITETGKIASRISACSPEDIGMILAGVAWDVCVDDLILISITLDGVYGKDSIFGWNPAEADKLRKISSAKKGSDISYKQMTEAREKLKKKDPNVQEWEKILSVVFNTTESNLYYKYRLICCDGFLDGLMVYRAFQLKHNEFKIKNMPREEIVKNLKSWCAGAFINYANFIALSEKYMSVASELVLAGINIYRNDKFSIATLPLSNDSPFMDALVKTKLCIAHGYGFNKANYNEETRKYEIWWSYLDEKMEMDPNSSPKLEVSWSMFDDPVEGVNWKKMGAAYEYIPKTVLFKKLDMHTFDKTTNTYRVNLVGVSVLSGYC